jgi:hypothetical protein
MACQRKLGCHACIVEQLDEDMRLFRAAIVQFICEPDRQKMLLEGHTILRKIDEYYSPRTED